MNYYCNFSLIFVIGVVSFAGITPFIFADTFHVVIPDGTSVRGCEINNECYIPYEITIDEGDQIIWSNEDLAFHTVTSGNPSEGPNGFFDSGMFKIDEQFQNQFVDSGNFNYFCTLHPWMEGVVIVQEASSDSDGNEGGGCLIATATFGSELSPQVQKLREIRDNALLKTEAGSEFMKTFNSVYYTFSPSIADYERENPFFKEAVKIALTPMISGLSILNHIEINSESEVLGYGISLILLNIVMYFGVPATVIFKLKRLQGN